LTDTDVVRNLSTRVGVCVQAGIATMHSEVLHRDERQTGRI